MIKNARRLESSTISEDYKNLFKNDVESSLYDRYRIVDREVRGQAISFLQRAMREMGWKNLGNLSDFETLLRNHGFKFAHNASNNRGNIARIVVLSITRNEVNNEKA